MILVPVAAAHREVPAAAELLARSFADDPGARHLFPARSRHALLTDRFRAMATAANSRLLLGRDSESGALEACLIFHAGEGSGRGVRGSARLTPLLAAPGVLLRMTLAAPALARLARSTCPAGAWTLAAIGVEPDLQGSGRGSALVGRLLQSLDAAGAACYLETVEPRNLSFYQRHGFAVAGDTRPRGSVRTWAMVRQPAGGTASAITPRTSTI